MCVAAAPTPCDDQDPCTQSTCTSVAGCVHTPIAGCCHTDADCDDGNPCTEDRCPGPGLFCRHIRIEGCCLSDAECDDGDPCTLARCTADGCTWQNICCAESADCDDGDPCTTGLCYEGACFAVAAALTPCCPTTVWRADFVRGLTDGFTFTGGVGRVGWSVAPGMGEHGDYALYYGDPERGSYDTGTANAGSARSPYFVPPHGARSTLRFRLSMATEPEYDALFVDVRTPFGGRRRYTDTSGDPEWRTVELDLSATAGLPTRVVFGFAADALISERGPAIEAIEVTSDCAPYTCDDDTPCEGGNRCAPVECDLGVCRFEWLSGCCSADGDCADDDPCTANHCDEGRCTTTPVPPPDCCTRDDECVSADPCLAGVCLGHRCELRYETARCPLAMPYYESFDDLPAFATGGFTAVAAGGGFTNWRIAPADAAFASPYARFDWRPAAIDYTHCLRTPPVPVTARGSHTLTFSEQFGALLTDEQDNRLEVRASFDEWTTATVLWSHHERDGNIARRTRALPLTPPANAYAVSVAFCVTGRDSSAINHWSIDDVWLWAGAAPAWSALPALVAAQADAPTDVLLTAHDADGDPLVFTLGQAAPPWAEVMQAPGEPTRATLRLTPARAHEGRHAIPLAVHDGGPSVATTLAVEVVVAGEAALFLADFEEGDFVSLGMTTETAPAPSATTWRIVEAAPSGAGAGPTGTRHARFTGEPALTAFSDALVTPELIVPTAFEGLRLRFAESLTRAPLPRPDVKFQPFRIRRARRGRADLKLTPKSLISIERKNGPERPLGTPSVPATTPSVLGGASAVSACSAVKTNGRRFTAESAETAEMAASCPSW
jgi:hypothetical protein